MKRLARCWFDPLWFFLLWLAVIALALLVAFALTGCGGTTTRTVTVTATRTVKLAARGERYPSPAAVPITIRLPPYGALHLAPDN